MRQKIAASLIKANQNSISPKLATLNRLNSRTKPTVTTAGSHAGTSGHQNFE
ncbi:Uncharacterised protein [Mycobacterium tuberculosis]|nr:Uncharacterised protein [Mycobacterium tuberculosis]